MKKMMEAAQNEDEIISMCCNNLVQAQNLIMQLVPVLGMYSDNYFVKLPRRVTGDSSLDWVQETLARDTQSTCLGLRDLYLTGYIILWSIHMG